MDLMGVLIFEALEDLFAQHSQDRELDSQLSSLLYAKSLLCGNTAAIRACSIQEGLQGGFYSHSSPRGWKMRKARAMSPLLQPSQAKTSQPMPRDP